MSLEQFGEPSNGSAYRQFSITVSGTCDYLKAEGTQGTDLCDSKLLSLHTVARVQRSGVLCYLVSIYGFHDVPVCRWDVCI